MHLLSTNHSRLKEVERALRTRYHIHIYSLLFIFLFYISFSSKMKFFFFLFFVYKKTSKRKLIFLFIFLILITYLNRINCSIRFFWYPHVPMFESHCLNFHPLELNLLKASLLYVKTTTVWRRKWRSWIVEIVREIKKWTVRITSLSISKHITSLSK